ncbi:MAG: protein kinase [Labilithrix sp.]
MSSSETRIGKYVICGELAAGGMATIWIGHSVGSSRPVAIKRLPPQYASNIDFVTMFMDEMMIARRVRHVNVVETLDVLNTGSELCLVMEYVEGETLSRIIKASRTKGERIPLPIASSIISGALDGLHAVHEARADNGAPLNVVHRDVSPQNVMVGIDGYARLLDFGVAKAAGRIHSTRTGQLKGKIAYMAPEQLERDDVTRASDVYAAGVVLWEVLAGRRLHDAESEGALVRMVLAGPQSMPSAHRPEVPAALDAVVATALARDPAARFATAQAMSAALERAMPPARARGVGDWVGALAATSLARRAEHVKKLLEGERPPAPPRTPSSQSHIAIATAIMARPSSEPSPSSTRIPAAPPSSTPSSLRSRPPASSREPSFSSGGAPPSSSLRSRAQDSEPGSGSSSFLRGDSKPGVGGKRILVIDDSEVILADVRRALEAEADGYHVTTTTQTVGTARFLVDCDLVIIDFHMPGIDGGGVIQSLRAAAQATRRTCLFYLYTADPSVAKRFAELGFDGAFTEKGDYAALRRQVKGALRLLQMRTMRR